MALASSTYCVIGAGASGLTAAKNLKQAGIPVEVFERQDQLGGNWYFGSPHSSVYASTHMISSKRLTEFCDFPMPSEYPPYPSHEQAWGYLKAYADHFGLGDHLRYGSTVRRIAPSGDAWHVWLEGEAQPRTFRGVVIANGHHWDPRWPDFVKDFTGTVLHAHDYRDPDIFKGQRVLVVGAGNSGCDIVVESARHAARTDWSLRRGYHFLPKFLCGAPLDRGGEALYRWGIPASMFRGIARLCLHIAVGPPQRYGLPRPDHPLFASHPIINSQVLHELAHGRSGVHGDVARAEGKRVDFRDGTSIEVDMILCATGYHLSFPFADRDLMLRDEQPRCWLHLFHRDHPNLYVVGMIQPTGSIWQLADYQAQLIAHDIV